MKLPLWRRLHLIRPAVVVTGILILPALTSNAYQRDLLDRIGILSILGVSYNLILGAAGQVSLSHSAFYAIGAYATAIVLTHSGLPQGAAIIVSLLCCGLAALLVGIPTLRLTGFYLAVATLAFTIVLQIVLFQWRTLTGGPDGLGGYAHLHLIGIEIKGQSYSYLIVLCALGTYWVMENVLRSPTGRAISAVRDHEAAAAALGIPPAAQKTVALVLSAVFAGIAGNLYAFRDLYLNPVTFGLDLAFLLFFVVVIGGIGSSLGAVVGVVVIVLLPELLSSIGAETYTLIYGVVMILTIIYLPTGLVGLASLRRKRMDVSGPRASPPAPNTTPQLLSSLLGGVRGTRGRGGTSILSVRAVTKRFGGISALAGATFEVSAESITALVGPNGAGKTSLFNIISGTTKPDGGDVTYSGSSIVGLPPFQIAQLGLIRTYQSVALFAAMTVYENLLAGYHRRHRSGPLTSALRLPPFPGQEAKAHRAAEELLDLFGLWPWRETLAASLPFGLQRRVETARAVIGAPTLLLLDEPAAGLNHQEIESLKHILRWLRTAGVTILLIEHNLPLVLDISDKIVVLNFGKVIAHGAPAEIQADPAVIAAYIGRETEPEA